jgi:hypothetical protein
MTDTTQASTAAGGLPGGWLRNFEEIVACTALTVVVLSTSWGVFTRYVSAQPATWSAEIAAVGFCWAIFLGSAAAFKRGQHISIDMLTQALPATVRRVLGTATDLLVSSAGSAGSRSTSRSNPGPRRCHRCAGPIPSITRARRSASC